MLAADILSPGIFLFHIFLVNYFHFFACRNYNVGVATSLNIIGASDILSTGIQIDYDMMASFLLFY